eukprot:201571_1
MGCCVQSMISKLFCSTPFRHLMIGLDSAGKTQILYKLLLGETKETIPTWGFNVETIKIKKGEMTIWDVGGNKKIRSLWKHYYQRTAAIIFVVDSTDRNRINAEYNQRIKSLMLIKSYISEIEQLMNNKHYKNICNIIPQSIVTLCHKFYYDIELEDSDAKEELHKVLVEDELRDALLLVFANKMDLPNALSVDEISNLLGLNEIKNREWTIQPCSAFTGDGLYEGLEWIWNTLTTPREYATVSTKEE